MSIIIGQLWGHYFCILIFILKLFFMNGLSKVLLAAGAGLAVGAAIGMLYAPEEGAETRRRLMKKGKKLAGLVNDSIDEGRDSLEEIKGVLQKQLTKVNDRLEEIKF